MRKLGSATVLFVLATTLAGCGPTFLKTKGRVVKNGETFVPNEKEVLRVIFVPIYEDGKPPTDVYAAEFTDPAGGFQVAGKDLRGMPPGKYRVDIEYRGKRHLFDGNLAENSPFVFNVDASTKEIVIDLDNPPKQ